MIEHIFLSVWDSVWLPQWSFDFWIRPYLFGKGFSRQQVRKAIQIVKRLLTQELLGGATGDVDGLHVDDLKELVDDAKDWSLSDRPAVAEHRSRLDP